MPDRNRGKLHTAIAAAATLIVFGLLFAPAYSVGVSHTERKLRAEHSAQRYAESAESRILTNCLVRDTPEAIAECTETEVKAAEAARRSEHELTAQQDMGDWAFWLLWVSVASVVITTIGVLFVWLTLIYTKETLREAQDATKAAVSTNEIAERTRVDENRPWIEILDVALKEVRGVKEPGGQISITVGFTIDYHNVGNSVAVGVKPEAKVLEKSRRDGEMAALIERSFPPYWFDEERHVVLFPRRTAKDITNYFVCKWPYGKQNSKSIDYVLVVFYRTGLDVSRRFWTAWRVRLEADVLSDAPIPNDPEFRNVLFRAKITRIYDDTIAV